jgi:hypothetical protein
MTINPNEASAMLADVEAIIGKVKQSRAYRVAGLVMILWGVIVIMGNVLAVVAPRWAGWSWLAADSLGVLLTFLVVWRNSPAGDAIPVRLIAAFALFFLFGLVWSSLIGRFGPRELDAFWPTLFLFGYALAGIWFGAVFCAIGLGLAALILAGYVWSGDWFTLWLAVINGGGLILCGAWMRRA